MSKTKLEEIKKYYEELDNKWFSQGRVPMRSTEKGFWGVSNLDDVYAFFEEKQFSPDTKFIDLGCGDGRVVAVASLFVQASGIEFDEELGLLGTKAIEELGLPGKIFVDDFLHIDLSIYEMLYMYADNRFDFLKEKLLKELKGKLYLYHDTYHPSFLTKERITWIGQIPIFCYSNPTL